MAVSTFVVLGWGLMARSVSTHHEPRLRSWRGVPVVTTSPIPPHSRRSLTHPHAGVTYGRKALRECIKYPFSACYPLWGLFAPIKKFVFYVRNISHEPVSNMLGRVFPNMNDRCVRHVCTSRFGNTSVVDFLRFTNPDSNGKLSASETGEVDDRRDYTLQGI